MSSNTPEAPVRKAGAREWLGLAVLALPTLLISLDRSVLYLVLPRLAEGLRPTDTHPLWIMDIHGFLIVAPRVLPEHEDPDAGRIDLFNVLLSLVSVLSVIFGLGGGHVAGGGGPVDGAVGRRVDPRRPHGSDPRQALPARHGHRGVPAHRHDRLHDARFRRPGRRPAAAPGRLRDHLHQCGSVRGAQHQHGRRVCAAGAWRVRGGAAISLTMLRKRPSSSRDDSRSINSSKLEIVTCPHTVGPVHRPVA